MLAAQFAVARSGLPSPFRSPIATDARRTPVRVVDLGLEAAVALVQEHGDAVRAFSSRSPGPACRRRSGRRSRPIRGACSSCVVALGLEAAVAPVQEHGDGRPRRVVRGRQVGLAVAVQVADRDRVRPASGCVAPRGGERRRRAGEQRRDAERVRREPARLRVRAASSRVLLPRLTTRLTLLPPGSTAPNLGFCEITRPFLTLFE